MPKDPDWNNSQDIARYNYERWKEQQYIDNDNPHGTGGGSGFNPFTPRRGFAFGLALAWCAVVFQSVWGVGPGAADASLKAPPASQPLLVWKHWAAWIFLFASAVRTYLLGMELELSHLWRPFALAKLIVGWAVWVFVAAVAVAAVVGLFTLIYTR